MHFAYPPRKASNPPPFRPARSSGPILPGLGKLRRSSRLKAIALAGIGFLFFIYLITRSGRSSNGRAAAHHVPSGNPPVVMVTVLDEGKYGTAYLKMVQENRIQYAQKHGYETFFAHVNDYDLAGAPASWSLVVAMRHAITKFPDAKYIWFLDQNSFVMNPQLTIEEHVMKPARLEELMIKDHPVVPPDSIIKTFSHLRGNDVHFVLSQDKEGLSTGSLVVRNGDWAKFFLETWFDPIYRSYNFQKAETHALEHIVQWHPTILAKLALVDQKIINSYSNNKGGAEYSTGEFVVRFAGCAEENNVQACETDAQKFAPTWRAAFKDS